MVSLNSKFSLKQRIRFKLEALISSLLNRVSYSEGMDNLLRWLSINSINIDHIFDVGASNGSWTKLCLRYYPSATYTLIEAQKVHSNDLIRFAAFNASKKLNLRFVAAGGEVGRTRFDVLDPFGGALITPEKEIDKGSLVDIVECETLDYIMSVSEPFTSALIKLDTHGAEKLILDNARECLSRTTALIVEAYNYRLDKNALLFWELCAYLSEIGFSVVNLTDIMRRPKDSTLWQMDILFIRSEWRGFKDNSYK